MKKLIKYLLFAMILVVCGCDERFIGVDDNDLITISEDSLNYNVIGGHVYIANYSEKSPIVLIGSTIEVVAVPETGYEFIGWFIGNSNEPVCKDVVYKFIASKDFALLAKFDKTYTVSVRSAGNGIVSFKDITDKSLELLIGSEVTVVATPDEKYDFLGWFVGDSEEPVSTEESYTFTVSEAIDLIAKFKKWPLISIRSAGNGSVSFENSLELSQYVKYGGEVTVVATPNENYRFTGWFVGNSKEPISTEVTYTFIVNEDIDLIAKFYKYFNSKGYDYVDLGLPSGRLWAAYNVGATKPEEFGGYYAWGETEEKSVYNWSTYKHCNGSYSTMTKYCIEQKFGTVDNKTVLDLEDDVAHVKWGGSWRMPTTEEQRELINDCDWEWTSLNGVNGYTVTGPNGNSIFLPAAGYRDNSALYGRGEGGNYWSSSLYDYSGSCYYSYGLGLSDVNFNWFNSSRYYGFTVRPVSM